MREPLPRAVLAMEAFPAAHRGGGAGTVGGPERTGGTTGPVAALHLQRFAITGGAGPCSRKPLPLFPRCATHPRTLDCGTTPRVTSSPESGASSTHKAPRRHPVGPCGPQGFNFPDVGWAPRQRSGGRRRLGHGWPERHRLRLPCAACGAHQGCHRRDRRGFRGGCGPGRDRRIRSHRDSRRPRIPPAPMMADHSPTTPASCWKPSMPSAALWAGTFQCWCASRPPTGQRVAGPLMTPKSLQAGLPSTGRISPTSPAAGTSPPPLSPLVPATKSASPPRSEPQQGFPQPPSDSSPIPTRPSRSSPQVWQASS